MSRHVFSLKHVEQEPFVRCAIRRWVLLDLDLVIKTIDISGR